MRDAAEIRPLLVLTVAAAVIPAVAGAGAAPCGSRSVEPDALVGSLSGDRWHSSFTVRRNRVMHSDGLGARGRSAEGKRAKRYVPAPDRGGPMGQLYTDEWHADLVGHAPVGLLGFNL
ncbi:MAG: hypothetical protein ACR2JH_07465 [Solirubrobacteraceae bacterium]